MISIGVIGDVDSGHVISAIRYLYLNAEHSNIFVQSIDALENDTHAFEILIVTGCADVAKPYIRRLRDTDFVIMNSDCKELFGCLCGNAGKLITYGFSGKACVTASSVDDEGFKAVQLCIQRPLPTLTGGIIEQQEFSVRLQNLGQSTHSILAGVTAALVAGLPVKVVSGA